MRARTWARAAPHLSAVVDGEARTWAGWEQLIFNKELNFNFREISCCHSSCMYAFGNPARASAVDRASIRGGRLARSDQVHLHSAGSSRR